MKVDIFSYKDVLTKLVSPIKKYKIIGFDIETHGQSNNLIIAGLVDDRYRGFFDKEDFINYIESISDKETKFVATNLGFDFQGIFFDTKYWDKYKLIIKSGRTLSAKHESVHMLDTMNYTLASVKRMGKQIGIKKLVYKKLMGKVPKTQKQWKYLKEYNKQDCVISKRWTEIFQDAINSDVFGCELKSTIASTSLNLYRRKFLPFDIYKEKIDCKEFIMDGYYGGRVEVFKRGKLQRDKIIKENRIKYYWYDYNSAYPFQMLKEYPLPQSAKFTTNGNVNTIINYHGTSDVTIECPYMKYPLLPYRIEKDSEKKLIFPYGKFRGNYNHIELRRALEIGYKILEIHKTLYYTQTFYPFKKYITYLYNLRLKFKKENNTVYADICKLFMNSLYGKLASKSNMDINFIDFRFSTDEEIKKNDNKGLYDDMIPTEVKNDRIIKGFKETVKDCDECYILPILSSCVTSYQRVQIHTDIVNLNGFYCDTDSILTTKKINDNMELGGLKLEKEVDRGWLIRPKCYMIYDNTTETLKDNVDLHEFKIDNPNCVWIKPRTFEKGWSTKVKGLTGIDEKNFKDILEHKPIKQRKFLKIKEAMRRGYKPNKVINFTKIQGMDDDKRVWSKPFNKDELQDSEPIYINIDDNR